MPEQPTLPAVEVLRPVRVVMDAMIRLQPDLPARVLDAMRAACVHPNPAYQKMRALGLYVGNTPKTIDLASEDDEGRLVVPRALTDQLRGALAAEGMKPQWDDLRTVAPLDREFVFAPEWEARPYQARLVDLLEKHQNVLAHSPTGSGKTAVVLLILAVFRQRTIVVMGRRGLGLQYVEDCERFLGFKPRLLGFGTKWTPPTSSPLTVASQPALYRCAADEAPHFGVLALDECQHASSRTHVETIVHFGARWRIGLSDDSTRNDKAEGMTYAHFGRVRDEVSVGELVADGKLVPLVLRVVRTGYVARDSSGVPIPRDALDHPEREKRQVEDEDRNKSIAAWVIATCDPQANAALVLSYRVEHCHWFHRALNRADLATGLLIGGTDNADAFDRCKADLAAGRIAAAAGTIGAVGEGFNLPRLDRAYLACAGSQNTQALKQIGGRFMRPAPGKAPAEVYYFSDGLLEEDPRLTDEENRAHLGWARGQIAGLRRLVEKNPDRFVQAMVLGRDGITWEPLVRPRRREG